MLRGKDLLVPFDFAQGTRFLQRKNLVPGDRLAPRVEWSSA